MPQPTTPNAPLLLHAFATFAPGGPQVRSAALWNAAGTAWRHRIAALDGVLTARTLLAAELDAELLEFPAKASAWTTVRAARELVQRLRPALVLTYNWGAIEFLLGAVLAGAPVLHHEDGFRPDEVAGQKRRRVWARRLLLPRARALVVPSRVLEREALERWKLRREQVELVPNGIELADFEPGTRRTAERERLRATLGLAQNTLLVGSVAHLRSEKNVARLLVAAASQPRDECLHYLIVGDGPERPAIEALASSPRLAGRVHLVGHQSPSAPWFAAMDLFALSSDTEQMPVALVEAMASGLACVATAVGDVPTMLCAEQAPAVIALGAGCEQRLGAALQALARDPQRASSWGRANRARAVEHYAFERMLARHLALWRQHAR